MTPSLHPLRTPLKSIPDFQHSKFDYPRDPCRRWSLPQLHWDVGVSVACVGHVLPRDRFHRAGALRRCSYSECDHCRFQRILEPSTANHAVLWFLKWDPFNWES